MSVCHVLNMANNGWQIVKALQNRGFDAHLIIDSADFGMGLPMWEEMHMDDDPYEVDFNKALKKFVLPDWVHIWWGGDRITYAHRVSELLRMTRKYDLLQLHASSPLYFQHVLKPYIVHDAGWIRLIASGKGNKERLGRRAYSRAKCVVMTNPDTYSLLLKIEHQRNEFIPFVIDTEQYKKITVPEHEALRFFHPTRHTWDVKGNDKLIQAFARFVKEEQSVQMKMIDWGWEEDVLASKKMIHDLGISDNVKWVRPYSKPDLIKAYNECDAVFDQFILGSGGTTCFEAMACEKPLAIYLNEWNKKCFGETPPVCNAYTVEEIYEAMCQLTDPKIRRYHGIRGRFFVKTHNHPEIIAKKLINLYEEILND